MALFRQAPLALAALITTVMTTVLVSTTLLTVPAASAGARPGGGVTACSRYGNGCITVPVRAGRFGLEMRLKGGTWIDCRGSCIDTLREETIDFWDTQRERHGGGRH